MECYCILIYYRNKQMFYMWGMSINQRLLKGQRGLTEFAVPENLWSPSSIVRGCSSAAALCFPSLVWPCPVLHSARLSLQASFQGCSLMGSGYLMVFCIMWSVFLTASSQSLMLGSFSFQTTAAGAAPQRAPILEAS